MLSWSLFPLDPKKGKNSFLSAKLSFSRFARFPWNWPGPPSHPVLSSSLKTGFFCTHNLVNVQSPGLLFEADLQMSLSFCWSSHVSSSVWSNVSMVTSLQDRSLEVFFFVGPVGNVASWELWEYQSLPYPSKSSATLVGSTNLWSVNSRTRFSSSSSVLSTRSPTSCTIDVRISRQSFPALVLSICRTRDPGSTLLSADWTWLAKLAERRKRVGRVSLMLEWSGVLRLEIDIEEELCRVISWSFKSLARPAKAYLNTICQRGLNQLQKSELPIKRPISIETKTWKLGVIFKLWN